MSPFYAYVHMRPDGTPFYVGKGKGARAHSLLSGRNNKRHRNVVLKHGAENIIVETMPCQTEAEAFLRERLAIAAMRNAGIKLCNLTDGGEGASGLKHSVASREKNAAAHRGKSISDTARTKMSAVRKGRALPEAHKAKIADSMIGNKNGLGVFPSDETRAKLSASRIGNKNAVGAVVSQEHKDKLSKLYSGRKLSQETRAKMSIAAKTRCARKINPAVIKESTCL